MTALVLGLFVPATKRCNGATGGWAMGRWGAKARVIVGTWSDSRIGQQASDRWQWGHKVDKTRDGEIEPEYTCKLDFCTVAIDARMRKPEDGCKSKNGVVAECARRDTNRPIGVADYELVEALPKKLESQLLGNGQIEREMGQVT